MRFTSSRISGSITGFDAEETMPLAPHQVVAFNTAHDSENKIHDDATARRFGFGGGLVPGVDVYAYMTHMPVARWGRAWLERGTAECRFFKPVYDGDTVNVTATETPDRLDIAIESRGEVCASGRAALSAAPPRPPALDAFPRVPPRSERPPADEASLATGSWLGIDPYPVTPEAAARYLADAHESLPIYAEEGLIHPRDILRGGNFVLSRNVILGPWIHVGSRIQHLATAPVGASLSVRAHVTANYEHKGHRFVELDALVLADDARPIAHLAHTAIYRPRQVIAA
jgi:acyl dehydratase